MNITEIISNNIKQLRKANNLTQQDVADAIHTDVSVYNRIESGKVMINHDKLFHLSKLFRVPIEKFFEGLGSNIQNNYDQTKENCNVQINFNQQDLTSLLIEINETLKKLNNK